MKLNGWIIYTQAEAERNRAYINKYMTAADRLNVDLSLRLAEEINCGFDGCSAIIKYQAEPVESLDFVINRTSDPFLAHHLETMGISVFNNAETSEICLDKRRSMQLAVSAGLPVIPSVFCSIGQEYPAWGSLPWQGAVVIKPVNGHGGRGVLLVEDEKHYLDALAAYEKMAAPRVDEIIIQKAASELGRDLRVYVIGSHIEAAMLRRSDPARDFRSNYCLGGEAIVYEPAHKEKSMIKQLLSKLDCGLVGIDLIFHEGEPVFNEIEDVVGSRMLYAVTDIDIADRYLEYIVKAVRRKWLG